MTVKRIVNGHKHGTIRLSNELKGVALIRWLPLLVIISLAALGSLLSGVHVRSGRQRVWRLVILAYLTGLGLILFTPISFDGAALYVMPAGTGQVNLTRLYPQTLGFLENICLTVPLGWLLKQRWPHLSLIRLVMLGLLIGGGIETGQYYMSQNWLINRSSDINDVLANALGIATGGLLMGIRGFFQRTPVRS